MDIYYPKQTIHPFTSYLHYFFLANSDEVSAAPHSVVHAQGRCERRTTMDLDKAIGTSRRTMGQVI
jgi:hypothetical protein